MVEDFKFILGIERFYYFFFFFFLRYEGRMRRNSLLDCMLWWLSDLWDAFWYWTGGKYALRDWTKDEEP